MATGSHTQAAGPAHSGPRLWLHTVGDTGSDFPECLESAHRAQLKRSGSIWVGGFNVILFFLGPVLCNSWRQGVKETWGGGLEARGYPENSLP